MRSTISILHHSKPILANQQALLALILLIFATAYTYETPYSTLYLIGCITGYAKLFELA